MKLGRNLEQQKIFIQEGKVTSFNKKNEYQEKLDHVHRKRFYVNLNLHPFSDTIVL